MKNPFAVSQLPKGPPTQRGVGLSPSKVTAPQTHAKPHGEPPRKEVEDDSSIHRVDRADNISKSPRTQDEVDRSDMQIRWTSPGEDATTKTDYPYRDRVTDVVRRVAKKTPDVANGLNPLTVERAKKCQVTLRRADTKSLRWIFSVDSGNGPKIVKLHLKRKKGVTDPKKMDAEFSCNCKAWRWLGSEHHAKKEQYLNGSSVGTASVPVVKDPEGRNKVCKHVKATIDYMVGWSIPKTP